MSRAQQFDQWRVIQRTVIRNGEKKLGPTFRACGAGKFLQVLYFKGLDVYEYFFSHVYWKSASCKCCKTSKWLNLQTIRLPQMALYLHFQDTQQKGRALRPQHPWGHWLVASQHHVAPGDRHGFIWREGMAHSEPQKRHGRHGKPYRHRPSKLIQLANALLIVCTWKVKVVFPEQKWTLSMWTWERAASHGVVSTAELGSYSFSQGHNVRTVEGFRTTYFPDGSGSDHSASLNGKCSRGAV